ncbi:hypothetical protein RhiirA4_426382 [Rhizophagus irregularis]|uniref:Uncharacterized protein n=1 Tax=Rhizophagus irregularis TaxID=588596 RepID=A0A2I1H4T7_9GLOM|nr:hypothetical protein RhiirA4_426382 [Rhizophagus irregularis]
MSPVSFSGASQPQEFGIITAKNIKKGSIIYLTIYKKLKPNSVFFNPLTSTGQLYPIIFFNRDCNPNAHCSDDTSKSIQRGVWPASYTQLPEELTGIEKFGQRSLMYW